MVWFQIKKEFCKSLLVPKLTRVDVTLGPEMKSTGEVMGKDSTLEKTLYKGLISCR